MLIATDNCLTGNRKPTLSAYSFGMPMPDKQYSSNSYRYGFNGKENDNEVKGVGNWQDYGMRMYDPRLGRFLSTDPLAKSFSFISPYIYAEDRPIDGIDLDGKEWNKTSTYNVQTGQFDVHLTLKVKVYDATQCQLTTEELQLIMNGIQAQFAETFTQFDKDRNINYTAELEYEFITHEQIMNGEYNMNEGFTIMLKSANTNPSNPNLFIAGKTPERSELAMSTRINLITLNIFQDGAFRGIEQIARTGTHESGHSAGLAHPWEINGGAQGDVQQGVAKDQVIKRNIMNSGGNPDESLRYYSGSGVDANEATGGQLLEIIENIRTDQNVPK